MRGKLVQDIVDAVSCEDFARRVGLAVTRQGFCCCPFHGEDTPSLKLYKGDRGWYCFGCHQGGDVIAFARKYYGLDFSATIDALCREFGIAASEENHGNSALAAIEAAKRKATAERREREKRAVETEYWAAFDAWNDNENVIADTAPRSYDEPITDAFAAAIVRRGELRARLDQLEMKRRELYAK